MPSRRPAFISRGNNIMTTTSHFVSFRLRDFSHLAFSCALEPLRIANLVSRKPLYRWSLASEDGTSATCSNGSVTQVNAGFEPASHADRLFLISGIDVQNHTSPGNPPIFGGVHS